MILSEKGIKNAIADDKIEIDPPPQEEQFSTSALDLKLGDGFYKWDENLQTKGFNPNLNIAEQSFGDTAKNFLTEAETQSDGSVILPPDGQAPILATTRERIYLPKDNLIAARVEGRSSLARLGLFVHITAPTIHLDFSGDITLEFFNVGPFCLELTPHKLRPCQLVLERVESKPEQDLSSQFKNQTHPSGEQTEF